MFLAHKECAAACSKCEAFVVPVRSPAFALLLVSLRQQGSRARTPTMKEDEWEKHSLSLAAAPLSAGLWLQPQGAAKNCPRGGCYLVSSPYSPAPVPNAAWIRFRQLAG